MSPQRTVPELLAESRDLEQIASQIQGDREPGLSPDKIAAFVDRYHAWFAECVAILPDDLEKAFRVEYQGNLFLHRISNFTESPTKPNQFYKVDNPTTIQISYWLYPYDTTFRPRLLNQQRILHEAEKRRGPSIFAQEAVNKIEHLARRLRRVVRQLQNRHDNRETLTITNEYDVQDLLHALLTIFFDDIRPEEWTPSYAGGHSRVDFLLKLEQVVVEVKKTRPNLRTKEIREQLIIDKEQYQKHPDCKALVAIVYDPDMYISNPTGFENDLSQSKYDLLVKVIVVQS